MRYRRLDENHDYCFGRGRNDYLEDSVGSPNAIQQAIKTILLLFLGEWWENTQEGLPLWQKILGQRIKNKAVIDNIIVKRIRELKLPNGNNAIKNILSVNSIYDSVTREYSFSCIVDTVYGKLIVSNGSQYKASSQSTRTVPSTVTWQGEGVTWQGEGVTWQGEGVTWQGEGVTWQGEGVTWQGK